MGRRTIVMIVLVVAAACSRDTGSDAGIVGEPCWRSLVAKMNLPDHKASRLDMYVGTLESSRRIIVVADDSTKINARASLDTEVGRALPLIVPAQFVEEAHACLRSALNEQ